MIVYRITSPHRYNRYLYPTTSGTNVFAADSVYDALTQRGRRLWWDADGNLSREYYRRIISLTEEERFDRRLCHNEEGLLQGYWQESGDRHRSETVAAWYAYDADGHRALKYASERAAGSAQSVVELCDPVYYVSPLVTLTRTGYSKHYFEGGRRICTVIGGGFGLVPWDSITHDPMPVVGPHDDKLAKVLLMGAESTFGNCIGVRAYLSNTLALYKTMLNESERYVSHEPAFYYHTERCRSREQSHACMSYAETRQRVRSQHLGSTELRYNCSQAETKQGSGYFPCFGSEVHRTSSSYGEDWVDVTTFQYDTSQIGFYQFNGKEKDPETDYLYYGARYHWPDVWNGWLSPDPLMDDYPSISPYAYCAWNPVNLVDPDGRTWKDIDGNTIKDHSKIKVYIFYDPTSFSKQTMRMYRKAERKYGKGSVALSDVTTEDFFSQDWKAMASEDIREINLNYHGSNQALHLNHETDDYITSTGDGITNRSGAAGLDIEQLPSVKGNINNAQLNINSCHSNKKDEYLRGSKQTLMGAFFNKYGFRRVRGTSHGVSYTGSGSPRPGRKIWKYITPWEYLPQIDVNTNSTEYIGIKR
ncbi:MAG: RHS repeat-associated core domain-containing protein [Bacteroidales bacterium]|nr:RHS repeat-associated core domain-containing protein [Bacteroidales bacterium]